MNLQGPGCVGKTRAHCEAPNERKDDHANREGRQAAEPSMEVSHRNMQSDAMFIICCCTQPSEATENPCVPARFHRLNAIADSSSCGFKRWGQDGKPLFSGLLGNPFEHWAL